MEYEDEEELPGAEDGLIFYRSNEQPDEDLVGALYRVLEECWEDEKDRVFMKRLAEIFQKCRTVAVLDSVQQWVIARREELPEGDIYRFASVLITDSVYPEVVKFGLALLELFDTEQDELMRTILLKLALHEEYTLFCFLNMRTWSTGAAHIWKIGQKCSGWGRVHALEFLEPETRVIEEWFLCEGWQCRVSPEFTVLNCAIKGDLAGFLRHEQKSTQEQIHGAGILLASLIQYDESNLRELGDAFAMLCRYLEKLALNVEETPDNNIINLIEAWLRDNEAPLGKGTSQRLQALELCQALLDLI
jgi:hypothetical protein